MKNKKLLIVFVVLLMLITSFLLFILKPNTKNKKLKELNYNVTYKEAFPDENLRRSVVLCIMRDKCNDIDYSYLKYNSGNYDTSNFLNDPTLGPEITEEELKTKSEERLSKTALDKLKHIVPNDAGKKTTTLQGIEYLTNLLQIRLWGIEQENVDFSYNKKLESLNISSTKIKTINLNENLKLKNISISLSNDEKILDLSHLINLKSLSIGHSGLTSVKLPQGIEYFNLEQNKISEINIPNSVKRFNLNDNNLTHIEIPEGVEEAQIRKNKLETINVSSTVKTLHLNQNKITSITLPSGMEIAYLSENKIENVTLRGPVKRLGLERNNISHIDLVEGIEILNLNSNKIEEIILPSTIKTLNMHSNELTHIELPNDIREVDLSSNKIFNIDLPDGIKTANLSYNKITNIDVTNKSNLVSLDLMGNYLEDIDVSNNTKLSVIKFYLKNSKDTIDFSNNPKLSEVRIYGEKGAKIKSLDFSNNSDLYILKLSSLGLTNLNIDNNINLDQISLSNNNLESLDLTNKTKLRYVDLYNNTSNLKLPVLTHDYTITISESRKLKIKKNSLVTIPTMIYNNKEFFIQDNPNYEKVGDKYVFKNVGKFNVREKIIEPVNGYWSKEGNVYYEFEVENGEEDSFNPVFNQGNYTPLINEEIPVNNLKEMITNLPTNIKNFEVLTQNTFTDKGDKTIKVRITFSDDTFKEIDIPIKIYEKEDILPTVTVSPETLEILDKKSFNINITRIYAKEDNIDNTNFIKTVRDNLVSYEYLNKANGLTYNSNEITGVIDYLFTGTEEEHTFNITYKEKGNIYTFNKNISIKLLRDTDKDGIADKDDDDKDGDGFSNAVEIARGSDPYNKDSLPDMSKKDELDNLVKQLEKLIEDTKNNPFDTKNKLDVDNLKNNFLPGKVTEKDNIKGSYSATTSDTDLLKLINKVKSEIDDIKKEINKLRDKANFEELDIEITKEIKDIYTKDSLNPLKEKLEEAKNLNRDTATQEEVDKLTKEIKDLRDKLIIDNNKKQKENKDINNPNTGIKTYSLIIVFIIFISYLVFKKKKSYIR